MSFEKKLQERVAYLSIGRSALRNQGVGGLVKISRDFMTSISLQKMSESWNNMKFDILLDKSTEKLLKQFPQKAKNNFGAARKALNLFFRDVVYNTFLTKAYDLKCTKKHLEQLELPLNSFTTKKIVERYPILKNHWCGIKYLTKECNYMFQDAALLIAKSKKLTKIHLDVFYWRENL